MLITQRMAQLGIIEQKPVNINLASHPYGRLVLGDIYTGKLGLLSVGKDNVVKDASIDDSGYTGSISVKSITRRNIVVGVRVYTKDAYSGGLVLKNIQKKNVVVGTSVGSDKYAGQLSPISLSTKMVVVGNKVDSNEAYSGIVRVIQIVKEEV